ncbi:hypothetical protein HOG48_02430 [Candidatus Peregrinibacteria bacterium]|jgi:hypothetical protein|nr:hypothetical protein [Candidatus Peregrinibacteria bacterium]
MTNLSTQVRTDEDERYVLPWGTSQSFAKGMDKIYFSEERVGTSPHLDTPRDIAQIRQRLAELQIPCPWEDFTKVDFISPSGASGTPYVPTALTLGCGEDPRLDTYKGLVPTDDFGYLLHSDVISPRKMPGDYVFIDLRKPETIDLFGLKVHAIISRLVFTYEGAGINFLGKKMELAAAEAISNLIMPGGLFCSFNLGCIRFEVLLVTRFGFKWVEGGHPEDGGNFWVLQKPFK